MAFDLRGLSGGPVWRELHLSRSARDRYRFHDVPTSLRGDLLVADIDAARDLAQRMNEVREVDRYPQLTVAGGGLLAAALVHELQHLLIEACRQRSPKLLESLLDRASTDLGAVEVDGTLQKFVETFPGSTVLAGTSAADYLKGDTEGTPNREIAIEEIVLLEVANRNPALERLQDLFDDSELAREENYGALVRITRRGISEADGASPDAAESLYEMLEGPILASPTSLAGQLRFIRERWQGVLGERLNALLDRLLLSLDILAEERKPGLTGPSPEAPLLGERELRGPGRGDEPERFSPDADWMPRLVMLAKSTYVWLDQLSRRYGRDIRTLDAIPDETLDEIAERGFTGLWLIGLWERSEASRRIKQLRGQADAVASAYAIHDYVIAGDLGGEEAYRNLFERASRRGLRLASDMVPNHMGIDSRWVVEHPDYFVQLDHSPFPGYTFDGPDLSGDDRVGIFLEDHYYDNSDAAVVFKRVDRDGGPERYIYHGNDGTAMPWNDTAQLDYLKPEVREAVMQTILEVARRFPVIRFDAAMTLAREHVQRLWYPEPGGGGAIPSRSQYGSMSAGDFERAMPEEFWREVVDRVAREVPGTLLLAEAFWLMEGYFVRSLGMHRVYNSAFMNMLKREANDEFRQLIRNVLAFEPQVLGRFVNFLSNPDEETAVAQFGKEDRYFGACTLLATMPGLPMFAHGQVEGYEEKYGMEFRRAKRSEEPDPWLIERHEREIFPLLHRRAQFAGVEGFRLFDFVTDDGDVNEDVIAYSNLVAGKASLVLFHNRYDSTSGHIHMSVPDRSGPGRPLLQALNVEAADDRFLVFRELATDLEQLVASRDIERRGLWTRLDAFGYRVLLDFRVVHDSASEPYAQLNEELSGRGVASVHDAVQDVRFRSLHSVWGDLLDIPVLETEAARASYRDLLTALAEFGLELQAPRSGVTADDRSPRPRTYSLERFGGLLNGYAAIAAVPGVVSERIEQLATPLLAWMALESLPAGVYERFRLHSELASGEHNVDEPFDADLVAGVVPLLLAADDVGEGRPLSVLRRSFADTSMREFLRVNEYDGDEYFDRDAFRLLTEALIYADALTQMVNSGAAEGVADSLEFARRLEDATGFRLERLKAELNRIESADESVGAGEKRR